MIKYYKILDKVQNLPTLPTIFFAFNEAASNQNSNAKTFAELISSDQATSSKILKLVNSAVFGFLHKIDSIQHAVTLLGINEIRNIIISMEIIDFFKTNTKSQFFNPVDFWKHSIATGTMSRLIAESIKANNIEHYFLSGILHDIGKLFLFLHESQQFELCIKLSNQNKRALEDVEKEVIGIDHSALGLLIAQKWNLPEIITKPIQFHHDLKNSPPAYRRLISAVHISDFVTSLWAYGNSGSSSIKKPCESAWSNLDLKPGTFRKIEPRFFSTYNQICSILLN